MTKEEKVRAYLESVDTEMVILGTKVLQSTFPPQDWLPIFRKYVHNLVGDDMFLSIGGALFNYKIDKEGIHVELIDSDTGIINIWSQHQKISSPLLQLTGTNNVQYIYNNNTGFTWQLPSQTE